MSACCGQPAVVIPLLQTENKRRSSLTLMRTKVWWFSYLSSSPSLWSFPSSHFDALHRSSGCKDLSTRIQMHETYWYILKHHCKRMRRLYNLLRLATRISATTREPWIKFKFLRYSATNSSNKKTCKAVKPSKTSKVHKSWFVSTKAILFSMTFL